MQKINQEDVTILINGKYDKYTKKSINSLKKRFPKSPILVSCWENDEIDENPKVSKFILNKDPGGFYITKFKYGININRIIVATQNGLKEVKTKYVLRIRNDLYFKNDNILNDFASFFHKRDEKYKIFDKRLISSTFFSCDYNNLSYGKIDYAYLHISDWLNFGLTTDVKKFWEPVQLIKDLNEFAYFNKKNDFLPVKMHPENYLPQFVFKENTNLNLEEVVGDDLKKKEEFDKYVNENFITLESKQIGFYNLKPRYKAVTKLFLLNLGTQPFNKKYISFLKYYIDTYEPNWKIANKYKFERKEQLPSIPYKIPTKNSKIQFTFFKLAIKFCIKELFKQHLIKIFFIFSKKNILKLKKEKSQNKEHYLKESTNDRKNK
ncbi:WavE lipopolysaccharide synthesis family protein [Mycoplasma sp. 613B]